MGEEHRGRVTLRDIADRCGFTVNTVSRALRGKSDISEATRQKIVRLAREMGYVGNILASSLRSGRSHMIAVIVSDVLNPNFSCVVHNIEARVREDGYSTTVLCTGDDPERELAAVRAALGHLADGVLICPSQASLQPIEALRHSGIPYVVMGRHFEDEADPSVLCDDEGGARMLTQALLSLGHRRILYVGGDERFSSQRERLAGYRQAMLGAGAPPMELSFDRFQELESYQALTDILPLYRPTALFAFRDQMAWSIIHGMRRAGVRVPEDLSVAGFDCVAEHLSFLPPLATVAEAGERYSTAAADRLLALIQGQDPGAPTLRMPMRLIDMDSTVRPLT